MEPRAGEGHRPQRVCEGPVPAPGAQPRGISQKIGANKKSPENSSAPSLRKVIPNDGF